MKGKKKILIIIVGIICMVAIVVAATLKSKSEAGISSSDTVYASTEEVKLQNLSSSISTKGVVEAKASAKIYSEVAGLVRDVKVEPGDVVTEGQVVIELDTEELDKRIRDAKLQWEIASINYENATNEGTLNAAIASAKTAYENAQTSYNDSKILYESGVLSKKDFDISKQSMDKAYDVYMEALSNKNTKSGNLKVLALTAESAKNSYEDLLNQREKAKITSPMNGTITAVSLKRFDMTTVGSPVAVVETVDELEISTYIGEYDINKIKVGMPVTITGYGVGDDEYNGKVSFVGSSAEIRQAGQSTEKSVLVKIEFDEKTAFKPNFSANIEIINATKDNATVVPYEALLNIDKELYVIKLVDGYTKRIKVEMGVQGEIVVEIISGELAAGDKVVLNPTVEIEDGKLVTAIGEKK